MRFLLPMLLACSSDIAIITTEKNNVTNDVIAGEPSTTASTEPSTEPSTQPATEPSSEMTELSVGLATMHFRQISCPACVGASGEFEIRAELLLHYPTSGD